MVGNAASAVYSRKVVPCGGGCVGSWNAPMSGHGKRQAKDKIARLAGQGLDLVGFWNQASEAVAQAVPHYTTPC
jgi:hypothetical protein